MVYRVLVCWWSGVYVLFFLYGLLVYVLVVYGLYGLLVYVSLWSRFGGLWSSVIVYGWRVCVLVYGVLESRL